jgi:hypothetical protein
MASVQTAPPLQAAVGAMVTELVAPPLQASFALDLVLHLLLSALLAPLLAPHALLVALVSLLPAISTNAVGAGAHGRLVQVSLQPSASISTRLEDVLRTLSLIAHNVLTALTLLLAAICVPAVFHVRLPIPTAQDTALSALVTMESVVSIQCQQAARLAPCL